MSARAAVLLAALFAAAPARAETLSWLGARLPNGPGQPWSWWLDARKPTPGGLPLSEVEKAFQGAWRNWKDVSCSYLEFDYRGRDSTRGPHQPDNVNVMGAFLEKATEDAEFYATALGGGAAVAVALPLHYGGTIHECDIVFNAVDYPWAVDGNILRFDVATVAAHESGHCLGLDHYSGDPNSVMAGSVNYGELRRGLTAHDVDNLCQLYPKSGAVGSSCNQQPCVAGLTCVGSGATAYCTRGCDPVKPGACPIGFSCRSSNQVPGATHACGFGGDGAILVGAPCTTPSDCGTPADVLCLLYDSLSDSWIGGYCSADCAATPCPTGSICSVVAGERRCLKTCRPGTGDCRAGYACAPVAEGQGRCVPRCRADRECAGDRRCDNCEGLCVLPGAPGARVGDGCQDDAQCTAGGLCRKDLAGGTCTASCANRCSPCPHGSICLSHPTTGEPLCFPSCQGPADCHQGFGCWQQGQSGGCMPACASDEECAVGQQCVAGSCLRPSADAGCVLCDDRDAGPKPAGRDAAIVSGDPAVPTGCGCAASPGGFSALAALALLGAWRRRRK